MLVRSRGFSVVELMIAVAIVAIFAGIAAPTFRNILATMRIKTAASDIHLSLMRARSEAIKRNANITVATQAAGWTAGWSISNAIEDHGAIAGNTISIAGPTSVTYTPNGRATTNPIDIGLTSSETTTVRCVSVSLSGHPTVKAGAC